MDPPTNAASHSPLRIALKAQSSAYIDELQAVSSRKEGPVSPKVKEIRFANIARLQLLMEMNFVTFLASFEGSKFYPVIPKPPVDTFS